LKDIKTYEMNPTTQSTNFSIDSSTEFDLKAWFFRVLRLWPWFLGSLTVFMLLAWFNLKTTEPVYQSSASIMIKDDKKTGSGSTMDNNVLKALNISGSGKLLENEIEVLKSADLIREVVVKEQLYVTIKKKQYFADKVIYKNDQPFLIKIANPEKIPNLLVWDLTRLGNVYKIKGLTSKPVSIINGRWYNLDGLLFQINIIDSINNIIGALDENLNFLIHLQNPNDVTLSYKSRIDIKQIGRQSTVISLSINDSHYDRGNTFLSSLIRIYNQQGLNDKNLTTANTMDFLDERLAVVERELRLLEGSVESFKRTNRVTEVSEQARAYLDLTKIVDQKKAEQETQVNIINILERDLAGQENSPRLVPSTLGITDPSATTLIEKHNTLVLQRERIASVSGIKNPAIADLDNQVKQVRLNLLENIRNLRKAFILALNDIKLQESKLNEKLISIPALEKQLLDISRDRNVKQQIYLFLLQKREESAIALASSVIDSRTVESPRGIRKVKPQSPVIYGISFALGIFIAMIPILLIDFFDDKVGSIREVIEKTRLPFIGEQNHVKNLKYPIAITAKKRDVISEQIRTIRTNISFTGRGGSVKKILVTSHIPGEGKSFTSLNIAASYAILGKRVAVLEFDLRKPRLLKNLGLSATKGISNYLSGQASLNEIIVPLNVESEEHFHLIPSGPIPPNPSELILGDRMQQLIQDLEQSYDYILFDTPPFSLVTDALLLKRFSDISIVVLRQGYSKKEAFRDIRDKLCNGQDDLVYIVLNGVNRFQKYSYYANKYSSYGYGYGYGNSYGYGNETKGYFDN
jgi:tyrosine-protein kinase Etk/Wzc